MDAEGTLIHASEYLERQAQLAWEINEIVALTWALTILFGAIVEVRNEISE